MPAGGTPCRHASAVNRNNPSSDGCSRDAVVSVDASASLRIMKLTKESQMAIDITSQEFRRLSPAERIQRLKQHADELYESEKAKLVDPGIADSAKKHGGKP
jgi:hypothetical protein